MHSKILKEQEKNGFLLEMDWEIRLLSLYEHDRLAPLYEEIFNEPPQRWVRFQSDYRAWGALMNGILLGFKLGYSTSPTTFYSVRGGVHPHFRRKGLAKTLFQTMILDAHILGYSTFQYHCFPYLYPGMFELGYSFGFTPTQRNYDAYKKSESLLMEAEISSLISRNLLSRT